MVQRDIEKEILRMRQSGRQRGRGERQARGEKERGATVRVCRGDIYIYIECEMVKNIYIRGRER